MTVESKRGFKPGGCCLIFFGLSVLGLCCILIFAGAGYYLVSQGTINVNETLNIFNLGPAEMQLVNLADGTIEFKLEKFMDDGTLSEVDSATLEPYELAVFGPISNGEYLFNVEVRSNIPASGSCRLEIQKGDRFAVAALPEGIVFALGGESPASAADALLATSPLCK